MAEFDVQDLVGLDRDVSRAVAALTRWRASLAADPYAAADEDPFDGLRHVAAKTTSERLRELSPSAADEPLRAGLRRWILTLVQTRVGGPDEVALAREASTARGAFAGPQPRRVSWREAWRGVVRAKTVGEVNLWLDAAADAAPHLSPLRRRSSARRVEVAHRLGLMHPWEPLVTVSRDRLRATALQFLDRTGDLSSAAWRQTLQGEQTVASTLHGAVGREAGDGWPARLTARWLDDTFGSFTRGLALDLPQLPETAGAASFARALAMFGFALSSACVDRSMPFGLARDPGSGAEHRLSYVFGTLAAEPEFHRRALGVGRRIADAQARILSRTALFDARLTAARLVLGDDVDDGREDFEDITARLFGVPLDARFRGAWPHARDGEPARWLGVLQAPALRRSLRDAFDIDWFRNPRAWSHLRSMGAATASQAVDEGALDASTDALTVVFEGALG